MNIVNNNLPSLSVIAAGAAPIAPASVVGLNVHHEVSAMLSGWGMADFAWFAIPVAIGAALSLEFAGAAICKTALEAWREKLKSHAIVAAVGAVAYTGMVVWSIVSVCSSKVFYPFALLSLLAYVGLAISGDVKQAKTERADERAAEHERAEQAIREIAARTALQKAETEHARAEAKLKAKLSGAGNAPSTPDKERAEPLPAWKDEAKPLRERVQLWAAENSGGTDREGAAAIGCGKSSVAKWRKDKGNMPESENQNGA